MEKLHLERVFHTEHQLYKMPSTSLIENVSVYTTALQGLLFITMETVTPKQIPIGRYREH